MQTIYEKQTSQVSKFWVAATTLGYAIQFLLYLEKDENYDPTLDGSILSTLVGSLPNQDGSNYHIIMNVFTSSPLLPLLKEMGKAATRTVRINRVEKAQLKFVKKMESPEIGSSDVVTVKTSILLLLDGKIIK